MTWSAESVVAVAFFPPAGDTPDALQPWLKAFGTSPQSLQAAAQNAPPASSASGTVGEFQVEISSQIGRTDIAIRPARTNPSNPPSLIDNIEFAMSSVKEYAKKVFNNQANVNRVAIVLNLMEYFDDNSDANEYIKRLCNLNDLPPGSSDLQFGFNNNKYFTEIGVGMNRICRWSTNVAQLFELQMIAGSPAPQVTIKEIPTANLQIDVNTDSKTNFDSISVGLIFDAISTEVGELLGNGYDYLRA